MKTIYHYLGYSRNYGDMAIQYSMQHHLQLLSPEPLNFIPIDMKQSTPIDDYLVDQINQNGDALIIGGGGLVMRGDGFDTESGWQFNIKPKTLAKLKVPLIIYAIGYNKFPLEPEFDRKTIKLADN
jgi:hypothetical protein